jgi:hypothetical protein
MRLARVCVIVQAVGEVRDDAPGDQAPVVQIALRLDGSMPAGVATGPDGAEREFTGWVGLMSAVDALAADPDDRLDPKPDGG